MLPSWLSACLQAPAVIAWIGFRCRSGARDGTAVGLADRRLSMVVGLLAAAVAIVRSSLEPWFVASTVFICGSLLIEALSGVYRRVEGQLSSPVEVIRAIAIPWLGLVLAATVLLAIPLATDSSVPDYRHNLTQHVLNSAFEAVSAACLVGTTIYLPAEDHSFFGQLVLLLEIQLAGAAFAAVGLSLIRPFLLNRVRLRTVLWAAFGLQAVAIAVTAASWRSADAPDLANRLWWSLVHAASALWNAGLVLRANGLADYIADGPMFVCMTTLALAGSLSLPVIIDILKGRPDRREGKASGRKRPEDGPWKRLPQWEAGAAFALLLAGTLVLWLCETPGVLPDSLTPPRPIDFGGSQVAIRDEGAPGVRWSLAAFVSATARSAGMQSIPISEGALSTPSVWLLSTWMFIGGSVGGTAGGMRITSLLLLGICLAAPRAWSAGHARVRATLVRAILWLIAVWIVLNVASIALLAVSTEGDPHDIRMDALAAVNGVGLTTGLTIHLTAPGRLAMILLMICGRFAPLLLWANIVRRIAGDRAGKSVEATRTA